MKNNSLYYYGILVCFAILFNFSLLAGKADAQAAQGKIIGKIDFDPETDGFGFENFGNKKHDWQKDLNYYDMMLMFGVKAVCVSGNSQATCVPKRTAENWRMKQLKDMDKGHCEGMSVTSLFFFEQREFKKRTAPADYQKDKETVNDLVFTSPSVQNYIAYFHVTQLFQGVFDYRKVYKDKGPAETIKELAASMNDDDAPTYTMSIWQTENGKQKGGHTITPIAVEDMGNSYRVHVYDNNYPNTTRYLTVEKGGKQTWRYNGASNPNETQSLYVGDVATRSFYITPNDVRVGKFFPAPFASNQNSAGASNTGDMVEFMVDDDADMLITAGDGKRIGYDWNKQQTVNEISGGEMIDVATGYDDDLPPIVRLPFQPNAKPYTVTLSGKELDAESTPDLMYSGPGFSIGFNGIRLDPNETLTFQVSPDGKKLAFTSSADSETPELYFSIDAPNGESYLVEVDGVELQAGKTLFGEFDAKAGKFFFHDNDLDKDKYDIDFERVRTDGALQSYETDDIDMGKAENFEMDFNSWDGKSSMCFRDDKDGNGFENDECVGQPNEDNDKDHKDTDDDDGEDNDGN